MKSVMKHQFSQVPRADIPRSSFDRSFGHKTAFNAGFLVPILLDEALPGDTFNVDMTGFARLATPIFPIMDNVYMDTFFFAVPYRLLWANWEKFCGAQDNPGDSVSFTIPNLLQHTPAVASISDYFGVPTGKPILGVSSLPYRAYNLIWNEWFRDQNLQNSVFETTADGTTSASQYNLLRRGKRHDYFTSCLPFAQKGPAVSIPLGQTAGVATAANTGNVRVSYQATVGTTTDIRLLNAGGANLTVGGIEAGPTLYADLSSATAATINQLRQAFQIQKLLERDARGGTRYTEVIKAHFGVTSPDARLQRPEYLGGGSSPVIINSVPKTSSTDVTSPQGNLAAFGTVSLHNHGFTKSFTEHCVIMGLVSVRADLNYQQGLDRAFSRLTKYDFFWPALSHIGEQAVLNREIWWSNNASDTAVFGYQERFAEYRYKKSLITGIMNSDAAGTLDAWHLAQDFATLPLLNATFIEDNPPIGRVVAVPSQPHFIFDSYFSMRCARPMPLYGVPGFIDHF